MSDPFTFGGPIVWRPTPAHIARANLTAFMAAHGILVGGVDAAGSADRVRDAFDALMRRSTDDVAWFTDAVLRWLDIRFSTPYTDVVDLSRGIQWPVWCVGGRMNIVHICLDKHAGTATDAQPALIFEGEEGVERTLTYAELRAEVNRAANALTALGLGKGDAVGIFMPMVPEIVVGLLAIAKIGAIALPLFSGYGAEAIIGRLVDADAKAILTADGAFRRGKPSPMKPVADDAAASIPTLRHMIVLRRTSQDVHMTPGRDHWWHDLVASQATDAPTADTAAEDPLMLIYTSGTTGKPKGALHTHCGFPVKAAQDMAFGTDVHAGDRIFWMTDMGWMMGPWLVFGSLLLGATCVLYDGAPDFPGPDRIWSLVARHNVDVVGLSPTWVRGLVPHGDAPHAAHDLACVRAFASTGEPWNPDPWHWLFERVGRGRVPIINYSGGTEISGGIVMGNPILPLKACAFSGPCPGIAADVVDESGRSVRNAVGELVIRAPWIGMTRGFWKDPDRYIETYWSRFPDVWVHGDFAAIDEDGLWYILGRSDDTIKIAGKRLGPAEVESVLVHHPAVVEAAAIGVPDDVKGSALVCFCVLRAGAEPSEALRAELRTAVVAAMGKALAPKAILFAADLPKTRNAKVMRRMVRSAHLGLPPGDTSSLVNPDAVTAIAHAS
ncbi:MAG: AMP-binding protein [Ardenticatenales bacterium]|nr:AMP-binding protein [Ardenticatenales bacterium]